jgi:hypothetical protein
MDRNCIKENQIIIFNNTEELFDKDSCKCRTCYHFKDCLLIQKTKGDK